jgi:hypothetical protein
MLSENKGKDWDIDFKRPGKSLQLWKVLLLVCNQQNEEEFLGLCPFVCHNFLLLTFWLDCTKCIRLLEWWMLGGWAGCLYIGYCFYVINSSHNFRLTFFKLFTVVMNTLKICMWLFESVWTLFGKFICSWMWYFFQHVLNRWYLFCVIDSFHIGRLAFSNAFETLPFEFFYFLHHG